jgi:cytochrome c biogenesis protein CcmG/thiol:disulfide interchange protein DsbE
MNRSILPIVILAFIVVLLWRGLSLHPTLVPSPLINQPAPQFKLTDLLYPKKYVTNQDLQHHVTLLNVWATWCQACVEEHPFLLHLAQQEHVRIIGLDYKDDIIVAKKYLHQQGNPYQMVAVDLIGDVAINFGVYGTPETYVIDKQGLIRYKQIGPITLEAWEQTLKPLMQRLEKEK